MRILVTGAGLLGAHVAAELLRAGHHVTLADLRPQPRYLSCVLGAGPGGALVAPPVVHRLDVRDVSALRGLLAEERIGAIVHTAGLLGDKADRHPYLAFVANATTAAAVAEAARRGGVVHLVQLSSLAVYDWPAATGGAVTGRAVTEEFPTAPRTPYATSKLAGELAVTCYAANDWLEVAVLRLAGVYGPGLFAGGALLGDRLQRLVARALAGRAVRVPGALAGHEYLHAADAAAAVRLVLEQGSSGVYNVGTGRVYRATEVAAALREAVPGVPVEAAPGSPALPPPLDTTRLRRELPGWRSRPLAAGLAELAGVLRDQPWLQETGVQETGLEETCDEGSGAQRQSAPDVADPAGGRAAGADDAAGRRRSDPVGPGHQAAAVRRSGLS